MKTAAQLAAASALLISILLGSSAFAQTSPPPGNALPPPAINTPGTRAVAPARSATAQSPATGVESAQSTALPTLQDAGTARDARNEPPPEVRVYQQGTDSVQEYARNGQIYMVVVTSKAGIVQTYMVDPEGRLVDEHGQKPVRPVMYKVLEWGKSKPASAQSSAPPADSGH
ncbi:MAG TPA: DUF2782 domain-containing protein [Rhodanobacter sp.]|jgi:Protein of unknown function (DUF2782).